MIKKDYDLNLESKIPKQIDMNEKQIFERIENETNIALNYWSKWKKYSESNDWINKSVKVCATELPSITTMNFNNNYWQSIINKEDLTLYLYNAYYDNRKDTKIVRIFGVTNNYEFLTKMKFW